VQEVTTLDALRPTAVGIAREIAANAPLAVQSIKRTIDAFAFRGLSESMRFEAMSASTKRELIISTSSTDDRMIRTDIVDTGTGFSEDGKKNLFEPFITNKAHGMGVGLTISRSIVEAHYGELWGEPNPDGGAILSFTLPLADHDEGPEVGFCEDRA
jgi:nitrogen fixation/metabolism regulation signal transduction histidine kinase